MSATATVRKPLGVRVTPEQHRVIVDAAKREHRSVASFVVDATMRAALMKRAVVQDEELQKPKRSREELRAIIAGLRKEYQAKNPGRNPLEEFLSERREAALRGE